MCVWHLPSLPTPLVIPGNSLRIGPTNLHLWEKGKRRWREGRKEAERGEWGGKLQNILFARYLIRQMFDAL